MGERLMIYSAEELRSKPLSQVKQYEAYLWEQWRIAEAVKKYMELLSDE
tara:strand:+ start:357 stop:503 length:147 start_codon:yes stop_codon:yes gene_type:complete